VSLSELNDVAPPLARLRLEDPEGRFRTVRLVTDVYKREAPFPFARAAVGEPWELRLPLPAVDRFEYLLQVVDGEGDMSLILDPEAPTASGPFGAKSVFEVPDYEPPAWVGAGVEPGTLAPLELRSERLRATVHGLLWSPPGTAPEDELPLLVVHDGPEYAQHSALVDYLAWAVDAGEAPPHRAALLAPVRRNDHYAASPRYAAALVEEMLPALGAAGPVAGVGASLGALALLHAQRESPHAFAGLFLQSGSFFQPATDPWEEGFPRFGPITRFVGRVLKGREPATPIPVALTCGTGEENLANNRALRNALARQGYEVELALVRDGHTWIGWRDSLHPQLARLLSRLWG
jgi:enterochelin esterase family protein